VAELEPRTTADGIQTTTLLVSRYRRPGRNLSLEASNAL